MAFDPEKITFFAKTDARGKHIPFGIKAIDRTRHMYVIGKTGMGKSTLLENMAVQDIQSGEGLAFIDPHGQTAETLLDYVPEHRKNDVLYFAPFDVEHPVAFNVMEDVGPERRHLVVSGLMSVFKKIWVDAWSARMEYILQNTLLALLEYPDSTLLGVNRMLSDKKYRQKVVENINDPAVKSFWMDEFANYNERYMQEAGDAIKNKIGQFTANPLIRNIIGQPKSSFDIRKIMDERKILIMNLSKGLVGESNANLLGSMLTTRIYLAAMSRADLPVEQMREMPNFYFYVDEFQSFANATFADILSEARKYKLNLTIAHQYIEQMEEEVKNAVFGNVGTIVAFRVGPFDAEVLETIFAPQFTATDIVNLGFAQIYLTLMIDGIGSPPFSAITLPPIENQGKTYKNVIVSASREQFAFARAEVEKMINEWHESPASDGGGTQRQNGPKAQSTPKTPTKNDDRDTSQHSANGSNKSRNNGGETGQVKPVRERSANENSNNHNGNNSNRRKGNGNHNEKSIEDLRSVLKKLSGESGDAGGASGESKKTDRSSRVAPASPTKNSGEMKSRNNPTTSKQNRGDKNSETGLRGALATMIDALEPAASQFESLQEKQESAHRQPASQREEVQSQADEADALEAKLSQPASQTASQKKPDDPLDPKRIERMMKVPPGGRTPF